MVFNHLTENEGLSQSTVYDILQDDQGFMWFATEDGLNRYDGQGFRVFRHDPADSSSLPSSTVFALIKDRAGRMWVGTHDGLCLYDPRRERFRRFSPGGAAHDVRAMYMDDRQRLWLGTMNGLRLFHAGRGRFVPPPAGRDAGHPLWQRPVMSLTVASDGYLHAGYKGGLAMLDISAGGFAVPVTPSVVRARLDGQIVYALHADTGRVWIGTNHGLYRYDTASGALASHERLLGERSIVWRIIAGDNGRLWLGVFGRGLIRFDTQTSTGQWQRAGDGGKGALSENRILSLYRNPGNGTLWVGTVSGGLNVWFPGKLRFRAVPNRSASGGLAGGNVYGFCEEANGDIWIVTSDGLQKWEASSGHLGRFFKTGMENYSVALREAGHLWLGSIDGLWLFDTQTGALRRPFPAGERFNGLRTSAVIAIQTDSAGLWLGSRQGLIRYDPRRQSLKTYRHDAGDSLSLPASDIRALFRDSRGRLWVGTIRGLCYFDERTERFHRVPAYPENARGLPGRVIYRVVETRDGSLWIGSDAGLSRYRSGNGAIEHWDEKDGLPNRVVYGILEDEDGYLWLSTNRGLSRFDRRGGRFDNFDPGDGLQALEFNMGAVWRRADGEMLFGGIRGMNRFYPRDIRLSDRYPPVVITGVTVFGRPLSPPRGITPGDTLRLRHDRNFFTLKFAALEYGHPARIRYKYRLAGFDQDWVFAGRGRSAVYTNVPPGDYLFQVTSTNGDGRWNPETRQLAVIIPPPFWETWWFRALLALFFLLALWGVRAYQLRRIREITAMRARIAADLHDDIASSLASVTLYSEVINGQLPRMAPETRDILKRIGHLSREALEGIGQIVWAVDPRHDRLPQILKRLEEDGRALFRAAGVDFRVSGGEGLKPHILRPDQRRALYLILKEGMNNIARHARCGEAVLEVTQKGNRLHFTLRDNGRGFDIPKTQAGHGLENMRRRARDMGAELDIVSAPGEGTRLRLKVKMA